MVGMLIKLRGTRNIYNGLVSKCWLDVDYNEDVSVGLKVIWNDGDITLEEIHKEHDDGAMGELFFYHDNKWLICKDHIDIMIEIVEQSEVNNG